VDVRDATARDAPDLLAMWAELRQQSGRGERGSTAPSEVGVLDRLREVHADVGARLVVATRADVIVGMALLVTGPVSPLADGCAVHVHYLHVRSGARRSGVGRALVAAAVAYAEENGCEHVVGSVAPTLRDANRFYARLGFGPVTVRRVASVAALRRRLGATEVRRTGLDPQLWRRRTQRVRVRMALARVVD
jgi:ribosomal protein S18 acetylase RimI-like enzyme